MTKTEELREKLATLHRDCVYDGLGLSEYNKGWIDEAHHMAYLYEADLTLKACKDAGLVFVEDAELPLEMYETIATTKLAKLIRDYCKQAGFRQTKEIELT